MGLRAKYSQLAFVFPAATVAGWLMGDALDRWLHTTWLYLAGRLWALWPILSIDPGSAFRRIQMNQAICQR